MIAGYYPTPADAEALHAAAMLAMDEQPRPLVNLGALDGALHRPRNAAHYEDADLATQAAMLMGGIAHAHAFEDGNKRTALMVGDVFLQNNGLWIVAAPVEIGRQIEGLLTRDTTEEEAIVRFAAWLRPRLQPLAAQHPGTGAGASYDISIDLRDPNRVANLEERYVGQSADEIRASFLDLVQRSQLEPVSLKWDNYRVFGPVRLFILAEPEPGLFRMRAITRIPPSDIGPTDTPE